MTASTTIGIVADDCDVVYVLMKSVIAIQRAVNGKELESSHESALTTLATLLDDGVLIELLTARTTELINVPIRLVQSRIIHLLISERYGDNSNFFEIGNVYLVIAALRLLGQRKTPIKNQEVLLIACSNKLEVFLDRMQASNTLYDG